ncbi:MAG: hypothetical protein WKG07_45550 [Hymenobacter sp.]
MEKEARVARQRGLPTPINPSKQATDDLYDEAPALLRAARGPHQRVRGHPQRGQLAAAHPAHGRRPA